MEIEKDPSIAQIKRNYAAKYYAKNRSRISKKKQKYYAKNRSRISEKKQKYYIENRERLREEARKYYEDNRIWILEKRRKYCIENRERIAKRRRIARKLGPKTRRNPSATDALEKTVELCPTSVFLYGSRKEYKNGD